MGLYLMQCGRGRGLPPCQVSSRSIQPFGHNTPTSQTGQTDRQRSDRIGRTVLQMVAKKTAVFTTVRLHYVDNQTPHHTTTVLRPFLRDHPGEPVPEENFWTLWCNGRLTEADTLTIRLGTTPSRLTSAHQS